MAKKGKRYQSGHEIFKEFIPDYDSNLDTERLGGQAAPKEDAARVAIQLLQEFESHLRSPR